MYPFGAGNHNCSDSYPIIIVQPNPGFPDQPQIQMPFGSGLPRIDDPTPPNPDLGFIFGSGISNCDRNILTEISTNIPISMPSTRSPPNVPHIHNDGRPFSYTEPNLPIGFTTIENSYKPGTPTVLPFPNYNAVSDAAVLRKAMKGFGTDEDALISIICHRNNTQRQEIAKQYKTHYGRDLIEDIKSETRGNFEDLLVALLTPIVDYYCVELHDSMAGIGTDEDVLIEIMCALSNVEIETIKNRYQQIYQSSLEDDIIGDTSGHFKRLLVSLCNANRDESGQTDAEAARADASELLKAGELRVGTDESTFNRILCQRNFPQLRIVFDEYEKMTGNSMEKAIETEFSGDIKEGLLAIVQVVRDKHEFFSRRLHKSMHGLGTNDRQLIRMIVTRCEIDMVEIKAAFERLFGKTLKSYIKGDTSGDYKHALYALIGEQRSS